MGSGKSLGMTIFTWYYSLACGTNVMSNIPLREDAFQKHKANNSDFILGYLESEQGFLELTQNGGGIIAWDEMHSSLDNRTWARKGQVMMTQFFMYLRKIGAPLFFTSQSIEHQLDVRVRNVLDMAVICSKNRGGFAYTFYDFISGQVKKRIFIPKSIASKFFGVFDTRRIVRPVDFPQTERQFLDFLDKLQEATARLGDEREIELDDFFKVDGGKSGQDDELRRIPVFLPVGG